MKSIVYTLTLMFFITFSMSAYGQLDVLKKAKEKAEKKIDKKVDKGLDKVENNLFGGDEEGDKENKEGDDPGRDESSDDTGSEKSTGTGEGSEIKSSPELKWAKYDFVPGDKVIFEDDLKDEENGEFPSRWDLQRGSVEIAELGDENVIMFRGGSPTIIPFMKNSQSDYLPDVFTVEFDLYPGNGLTDVFLWDTKNQNSPGGNQRNLRIWPFEMILGSVSSRYPNSDDLDAQRWTHIAIAYTSGKLKAYMDDTRLINIPRLDIDPTGISIHCYHASDQNLFYIKNIRIAEGGVKYYDRVLQDGKIVTNGIRFDVGRATLKPESMGIINEIVDLMKEHEDLNFSIEGHTDSDGDEALNMTLSEERALAVKAKMVTIGIDENRMKTKGWGESQPLSENSIPEGKANNRRVEFVKF